MRTSARVFLLVVLVLSCTVSIYPQEALWSGLIIKVLTLYHVRRYSEAAQVAEEALAVAENSFGSSHPNVLESLNILAILYYCQGEYGKAELLFERVLTILERTLGTSHPNVAACFNNLGEIYREQGKYAEAELSYKFALAIDEEAFGKNHPEVATDLKNLGLLYCSQGKYVLAEGFFKRALAIREKSLGEDHPDVASVLENMRECYKMPEIAKRIRDQIPPIEREEQPAIPEAVGRKGMEEKLSEGGTPEEEKAIVSKPPKSSMTIPERELDKKVFTPGEKELELLKEEKEVKVAEVEAIKPEIEGKEEQKPQVVKVEEPKGQAIPQGKLPTGVYTVHIASFRDKGNADRVVKELDEKGYKAFVEKATIPQKGTWYRVSVGRFPSRREALVFAQGLKKKGINYSFVRKLKEVKQ